MALRDHILAVDGGGTASRVSIFSPDGIEVANYTIGSLSIKSIGVGGVVWSLAELVEKIAPYSERIGCGVLGLSGLDSTTDVVTMTGMLGACGLMGATGLECRSVEVPYGWRVQSGGPPAIMLCSDALLPLFSTGAHEGAILIAGTGSVSLNVDESGTIKRFGGWGYQVSDEGSGTWIGGEFMRKALHIADFLRSRGVRGRLNDNDHAFLDAAYKATNYGFSEAVVAFGIEHPPPQAEAEAISSWACAHTTAKDYASLAKFVIESDVPGCRKIVKNAVDKISTLALCACTDMEQPLVLAGGLFANESFFNQCANDIIRKAHNGHPRILRPARSATWGALELAKHVGLLQAGQ